MGIHDVISKTQCCAHGPVDQGMFACDQGFADNRITSYNVCYTKLLRNKTRYTVDCTRIGPDRAVGKLILTVYHDSYNFV